MFALRQRESMNLNRAFYGTKINNCYENCITTRLACSRLIDNDFFNAKRRKSAKEKSYKSTASTYVFKPKALEVKKLRNRLLHDNLEKRNFSSGVSSFSALSHSILLLLYFYSSQRCGIV